MIIEELKPEHYSILRYIHDGFVPDPQKSIALVAMEGEEIIGRIFLLAPTHLEGPWIREDKRGRLLATQLVNKAAERAKACGISTLFAYAVNHDLEDYLSRLGFQPVPMTVWAKEI